MSVSEDAARPIESTTTPHPAADRAEPVDRIWRNRRRQDRIRLIQIVGVTAFLLLLSVLVSNDYQRTFVGLMLIYAIAGVGFYLILGMSGQFAFSHGATMGIGAYSAAYAARTHGFWVSLLFAVLVCAVTSALLKLVLWRASDFYFGIATLGFASVAVIVFQSWQAFTGVASNAQMLTTPTVFGWRVDTAERYYLFFIPFFAVGMLIVYVIRRSGLYRESIAVRDKPLTSAGLGVRNTRNQLVIYVIGSCFAGVAGALYAQSQGFISSDSFDLNLGINLFVVVIVGGMRSMWGPLVGAAFVEVFPEVIRGAQDHQALILAVLLPLTVVLMPEGLMGLATPLLRWTGRAVTGVRARRAGA